MKLFGILITISIAFFKLIIVILFIKNFLIISCTSSRRISKTLDNGKMLSLVGDDIPSYCLLLDSTTVYLSTIFMAILTVILIFRANFIFALITVISLVIYLVFMTKTMDKFSKYLKEQKNTMIVLILLM